MISRHQSAFTLVELIISVALGVVISTAIISNYLSSKKTHRLSEKLMRVQENKLFATHYLSDAVNNAGSLGCINRLRNKLNSDQYYNLQQAITGYEFNNTDRGDSFTLSTVTKIETTDQWNKPLPSFLQNKVVAGSDILAIKSLKQLGIIVTDSNQKTSASLGISKQHKLKNNSLLVVGDCVQSELFKHTGNNTSLSAQPGIKPSDNKQLGQSHWGREYGHQSNVYQAIETYFYVGIGSGGYPSLFRLSRELSDKAIATEELMEGIETLQIYYGEDTDDDGAPNIYHSAKQVQDWSQIVSVHAGLLFRSLAKSDQASLSAPITLLDNIQFAPEQNNQILRYTLNLSINIKNVGMAVKTTICAADELSSNQCFEL